MARPTAQQYLDEKDLAARDRMAEMYPGLQLEARGLRMAQMREEESALHQAQAKKAQGA